MRSLLAILLALSVACSLAHGPADAHAKPTATFTENHGQWPENVLYRALFPGGALFVEKNALTYLLVKGGALDHHGGHADHPLVPFVAHAYRVTFEGSTGGTPLGGLKQPHYENFYKGNDPANWGSHCEVYGEVWVKGVYPGIDLHIDGRKGLKYEFEVQPDIDPDVIRMRYDGQDAIALKDGKLLVATAAGDVVEEAPRSWVKFFDGIDNHHFPVPSAYELHGSKVSFDVKTATSGKLTIDPELTFGSYSGSSANNFGFTATYDHDGALYGGGIAFGFGYPVTVGVQQDLFGGGDIDVGVSKWTPDGTDLEWSTYIGGALNETPHSLVVNDNNELFVLSATGSSDFPTTAGCFDNTFNGGVLIPVAGGWVNLLGGEGYGHNNGTDIGVTHLSSDATALLGSTFVGGAGNDGVNNSTQLVYNYGDHFRGEIALDASGNPVVSTSTQSSDAPTTGGAPQTSFGGGVQDAYLFRLNPNLSNLMFATYYGGSQDDSGYGVQFASNGQIFITGGTASADLVMPGAFDPSYNGANDGYIARFSANGNSLLSATYLGTSAEDQSYFVQLNTSDEVFVVGQTHGAYPVTPGKYANAGSSQFIHKFSSDLGSSIWSTRIGNGSGTEDINPSAFLVSDCGQIYFSGWGGQVNQNVLATMSTTVGLPLSPDAFQPNTDGSDYYLMVLEPEAIALNYATYFGGSLSAEHVDGGTSRFDKNGNVYQAVCAGCWNNSDFPTTPGAWSNTNNGGPGACNLGVFKFNLSQPLAEIDIDGPNYICLPGTAQFINLSVGGTDQWWDFGDGEFSSEFEPSHTYTDTGLFIVSMVLTDSNSCLPSDTAHLTIAIVDPDDASVDPVDTICVGQNVQLQAHGGYAYAWSPPDGLSATNIADPIATPDAQITYTVVVTDSCGTDTVTVTIPISVPEGGAGPDTVTCLGTPVPISAFGGGTYLWSPAGSLNSATSAAPLATPLDTTTYVVTITTPLGCVLEDSLVVVVQAGVPEPQLTDTAICIGENVQLHAGPGDSYSWIPAPGLSDTDIPDPVVTPEVPTLYMVVVSNTCGSITDSAFVDVQEVIAAAWPDTTVCPGEPVQLQASGGTEYSWTPTGSLDVSNAASVIATPTSTTTYTVLVSSAIGCQDDAQVTVTVYPYPEVYAGADQTIDLGDVAELHAFGDGLLVWDLSLTLSCDTCTDAIASPESSTTYTVWITDEHGCKAADQVTVFINGSLFVPNTFTPNGDGVNDVFYALGTEVKKFHMYVFNRWGESIFQSDHLSIGWDGNYGGVQSQINTYVWRIDYSENNGNKHTLYGHVNLVR